MRNLVQPPPSLHCDHCNGELRLKLIEPANPALALDAEVFVCPKCGHQQSHVVPHDHYSRSVMEFAVDQLFDELPSPIVGLSLDRIEMAPDTTWRAASDFYAVKTSLILRASCSSVNGLEINWTLVSSTPLCTIALRV